MSGFGVSPSESKTEGLCLQLPSVTMNRETFITDDSSEGNPSGPECRKQRDSDHKYGLVFTNWSDAVYVCVCASFP